MRDVIIFTAVNREVDVGRGARRDGVQRRSKMKKGRMEVGHVWVQKIRKKRCHELIARKFDTPKVAGNMRVGKGKLS